MKKIIGETPMIKIKYRFGGKENEIYAKLEQYNLSGSIKDRIAQYIMEKEKERGVLKEGMPIVEATSGNTGIAFAMLGARYHHPVTIFMPNWVSSERKKLMESYGAKVILVSKEEGGFQTCIQKADELSEKIGGYRPNQFSNQLNIEAHEMTTGVEIIEQIPEPIGGFTSGIGTGGTLMGIGKRLRKQNPNVKIVALEPHESALLSGSKEFKSHKIEGIGDDFIPDLIDRNMIDSIVTIHDDDAIYVASSLATSLGLGVGISSGANLISAILLKEQTKDAVVTVFPDDNKKYISTSLMDVGTLKPSSFIKELTLLSYEMV